MAADCTGTAIWKHLLLLNRLICMRIFKIYNYIYTDSETISRHMNTLCIYHVSVWKLRMHVYVRKLVQGLPTWSPPFFTGMWDLVDSADPKIGHGYSGGISMSMSKSPPEYLVAGEWKSEDTVKMVKRWETTNQINRHQSSSTKLYQVPSNFYLQVSRTAFLLGPWAKPSNVSDRFSTSGFSSWESTNWSYQERSGKLTFQAPIWMYVFWGGTRKSLRKNGEKVRKPSGFRAWKDGNWSHYMVASQGTNSLHLASPLSNTSHSPTKPSSNDHII